MATTKEQTHVFGLEEVEETKLKRVNRFFIFKTEWWETVLTKHIGNDIYIETSREVRQVYLNGKPLLPTT